MIKNKAQIESERDKNIKSVIHIKALKDSGVQKSNEGKKR